MPTENGKKRVIPVKTMMHIRGFGLDGICGLMPMSTWRDVFGAAMAVEESAAKIFENGMQNSGFLSSKAALKGRVCQRMSFTHEAHSLDRHKKVMARSLSLLPGGFLPGLLPYGYPPPALIYLDHEHQY